MRALAAMTDPGLPASRSFRPDATTQVGAPNTQAGVSSPATGRLGAVPVRDPLPAWANAVPDPDRGDDPGPPLLDRSDREALFQAFADELELAAAELGIGSEA
jgi:hypothetical protein